MYENNKEKVTYILSTMAAPIFKRIAAWTRANLETLTIEQLFEEVKHYMGLHLVSAEAKRELNKITMKHTESVNEFYHRIFELWEDAETPEDERIEQFKTTLKPAISQLLLGHTFTDMRTFLDAARKTEDKKSIITNNFPRQWQEKSNSSKNSRSWNRGSGSSAAAGSSTTAAVGGSAAGGWCVRMLKFTLLK